MAEHLREQIMAALVERLTGLATTGTHVHRARVYPQASAKLPSLNLKQGTDLPVQDDEEAALLPYIDQRLEVFIEARAQTATGQVDAVLNRIAKEVTVAIQADPTLSVAGVYNAVEGPTAAPELSDAGETKTALLIMSWNLWYRRARTDPSQL